MQLLTILAILICPIVMGIMMYKMNKNMDGHPTPMKPNESVHADYSKRKEE